MRSVYAIIPEWSQTPLLLETAEDASLAITKIESTLRDRYRVEKIDIQRIAPDAQVTYRFAITYRTDEGIFHIGPAGLSAPKEHRPAKAFTHWLYRQRAHVLMISVDGASYEDALAEVNNIVALFILHRQPWGPQTVDIDGDPWFFDENKGFSKGEAPDA